MKKSSWGSKKPHMVDVRRAYRRWFWRRMSWMVPGLCVAVTVAARLAVLRDLELWLRLPALVISGGVALLFAGLGLLPFLVLRAKSRGDGRRAQSLRREFRSYPVLALVSLSVSLILLAVPLLFAPTSTSPPKSSAAAGYRGHGHSSAPQESVAALPQEKAPELPPPVRPLPDPAPVAEAPPPPAPEVPAPPTPVPPPLAPVASAPAELPSGQELFSLRFRPDGEQGSFSTAATLSLKRLDRAGLPGEGDLEDRQAPEFEIDLTILPRSRGWYGAIYEGAVDLPIGRNDSLRAGFFLGSLSDKEGNLELEATVVWQRATVEYERRLLGYTRHATFDLALRIGASVDRVISHEASISVDPSPRPAPWVGLETALWEQDGLGLVMQAGHSFALRLDGAAMSSTELKIELRIDVTESFSLELGWHYTGVRIHDKGSAGGLAYQELEQSFSGPVGGINVRF
jgi:hypothetical protein